MKPKPKLKKKMGRPKNEVPTRKVNFRWTVSAADWIEKKRDWIERKANKDKK